MGEEAAKYCWVRPATCLEEVCEVGQLNDCLMTGYVMRLKSAQAFKRDQISTALVHLRRQVPSLQICYGENSGATWFRQTDDDSIDLEMVQHDAVDEVLAALSRYRYKSRNGPLWCVKVLSGPGGSNPAVVGEASSRPDTGLGTPSPVGGDDREPPPRPDTGLGSYSSDPYQCRPLLPGEVIGVGGPPAPDQVVAGPPTGRRRTSGRTFAAVAHLHMEASTSGGVPPGAAATAAAAAADPLPLQEAAAAAATAATGSSPVDEGSEATECDEGSLSSATGTTSDLQSSSTDLQSSSTCPPVDSATTGDLSKEEKDSNMSASNLVEGEPISIGRPIPRGQSKSEPQSVSSSLVPPPGRTSISAPISPRNKAADGTEIIVVNVRDQLEAMVYGKAPTPPSEVGSQMSLMAASISTTSPIFPDTGSSSLSSSPPRGTSPPSLEASGAVGGNLSCVTNIVLGFHHGIADGFSAMKICGRLVKLLNDVLGEVIINDSFPLGDNTDQEVNEMIRSRMIALESDLLKKETFKSKVEERKNWVSSAKSIFGEGGAARGGPGGVGGRVPRHRNGHEVRSLDTATTTRLLERCQAEGVGILAAFSAVASIALMDLLTARDIILDKYNFYSSHSINLRRFYSVDSSQLLGCLVSPVHLDTSTPRHAADNFWDFARIYHADLKLAEDEGYALSELAMRLLCPLTATDYEGMFEEIEHKMDYYTSYLGDVTPLVGEGGPHVFVEYVESTVSRHNLGYACTHVLHLFRGSLCFTLNYSSRHLTMELAKEYITNIYRRLNESITKANA